MLPLLKEVFMIGKVYSAAVTGIYAVPVEVQADVAPGIPYFELKLVFLTLTTANHDS